MTDRTALAPAPHPDPLAAHLDTLAMLGHNGWLASAQVAALLGSEGVTCSVLVKDQVETVEGAMRYQVRLCLLTATRLLLWTGLELPEEGPAAAAAAEQGHPVPTYIRAHVRVVPLRALIDVRVNMLTHAPEAWQPTDAPANWVLVDFITAEQGNLTFRVDNCEDGCGNSHGDGYIEHDGLSMQADTDTSPADLTELLEFAAAVSTALAAP